MVQGDEVELILSLAAVLGALLIGVVTPGPSFVLVARTAMVASRIDALLTALGMGVGAVIFAVIVLFGLQAALVAVPWLYLTLKTAGGFYLLYMAIRIWRSAGEPIVIPDCTKAIRTSAKRSFLLGLFTQMSNPKTAIVYGGIFAALLPQNMPTVAYVVLPFLIFLVEAGWYAIVAYVLSAESSRATYLRSKMHIDRMAGGVMGFLGLKLISAARTAQ